MLPPCSNLYSGTPYNSGMPACQRHPAMHDPDEFFSLDSAFSSWSPLVSISKNLSAGRADDKIRVMVAEAVQTERELVTLRVAIPPADIVHVGHCQEPFCIPDHPSCPQSGTGSCSLKKCYREGDILRQLKAGFTYDFLRFQPLVEVFPCSFLLKLHDVCTNFCCKELTGIRSSASSSSRFILSTIPST